jgi:DNA-binding SARP family transcriptional activator
LLAALPVDLATELLVRVGARDPSPELSRALEHLVAVSPEGVRRTLRRLVDGDGAQIADTAKKLLAAVPIPPAAHVRIEVFGETRLLRDGAPVSDAHWRRKRVRQLACLLVTHGDIRRTRVGTLLWPERDEESVSANLRITLSYLQNLFEPDRTRGDATWFLRQDAGFLRLARDERLSVDAWEFEDHVEAAAAAARAASPSIELAHLQSALSLCRGDYLDDVSGEEWAEPLQAPMRGQVARAAVRAGELLVAAGRSDEAAVAAMVGIRADPYGEAAYRVGMRALAAAGDRDGALRLFAQCVQRLSELEVEPEHETITLASRFR